MKALMKQTIVEALAANDTDVESRGPMLYEQLKHLDFASWTKLMQHCMISLIFLLNRIRAIYDIMVNVLASETGRQEEVLSLCVRFFRLQSNNSTQRNVFPLLGCGD